MDSVTLIGLFLGIIGFISAMFTIWPFFGITSPELLLENLGNSAKVVVGTLMAAIVLSYVMIKLLRLFPTSKDKDLEPVPSDKVPQPTDNIDFSSLPPQSAVLVGRSDKLRQLTTALKSKTKHLAHIYASGGVGKSALTLTWLQKMQDIQPKYHGVEKIFAWSFYSQGSHDTQNSSVPFFQKALPFFGWVGELPKEDVAKGQALAKCLREKSCILVLDGLEPLQYPPQILDGELKDVAIKGLLEEVQYHGLTQPTSLIVISSRQPLVELELNAWLEERYITIDLPTLPTADGAKLLTQLGVKGARAELEQASEDLGDQALALVLLGRMLVKHFAGKIEQRDQLPLSSLPKLLSESLLSESLPDREKELYRHVWRVLQWYEDYYTNNGTIEAIFLDLVSLFDRPMGLAEKEVLVAKADCAAPLRALDNVGWEQLEKTLENASLLLRSDGTRTHWDCHPLIRAYFGQRFKETRLSQYQQAHHVLFDYYQSVPTKHRPDTLEELEPLYRAMVHGCLAGEYRKALDEVYRDRILRWQDKEKGKLAFYSINKFGAYSQDLTALAAFFPRGWSQPVQHGLAEADQAWLIAQASAYLMSLGRLGEAVALREVSLKMAVEQQDWQNASKHVRNLIGLYLPLGQLAKAATVARQAIQYAKQSGDLFEPVKSHASLATTLHRQGQLDQAQQLFQRAEQLQQEQKPKYPQLYSLLGFQYCALLLDQAQSVAECEVVLGRAEKFSKWRVPGDSLLNISLDHLTLARALWRLQRDTEAATAFDQAVEKIRKAGKIEFTPIFLIDRANFYLRPRDNTPSRGVIPDTAAHDLQEADSLIRRCGMKLYAVDCQLAWCRYYLKQGEKETARQCWERAKMGMEVTGYGLRAGVVKELGEQI